LLPLVDEELRAKTAQRLAHESPGQPLQTTALVHEGMTGHPVRTDSMVWQSVSDLRGQQARSLAYLESFTPLAALALALVPLVLFDEKSSGRNGRTPRGGIECGPHFLWLLAPATSHRRTGPIGGIIRSITGGPITGRP